jgi:hypothetical protein
VLFSRKKIAIFKLKTVPAVHGKAGRTTTRFFGVVVLADRLSCRKPRNTQLKSAQP